MEVLMFMVMGIAVVIGIITLGIVGFLLLCGYAAIHDAITKKVGGNKR